MLRECWTTTLFKPSEWPSFATEWDGLPRLRQHPFDSLRHIGTDGTAYSDFGTHFPISNPRPIRTAQPTPASRCPGRQHRARFPATPRLTSSGSQTPGTSREKPCSFWPAKPIQDCFLMPFLIPAAGSRHPFTSLAIRSLAGCQFMNLVEAMYRLTPSRAFHALHDVDLSHGWRHGKSSTSMSVLQECGNQLVEVICGNDRT